MKKEKLIEELNKLPNGVEVCVFDHRKNLNNDCGDGTSEGIYTEFEIVIHTKEEIKDGCIPFASIIIENDDYTEEGIQI